MWGKCGITLAAVGSLGYIAWMVLCLVYGIQALTDHSSSKCTDASFKWLWFIVVSAALFAWNTFVQAKQSTTRIVVAEFAAYIVMLWTLAISFALATQFQYIDGCSGKAHHVMFIYMCGNYAVAAGISLCGVCFTMDDVVTKRNAAEEQATTCNV